MPDTRIRSRIAEAMNIEGQPYLYVFHIVSHVKIIGELLYPCFSIC